MMKFATPGESISLAAWLDRWLEVYAPLRCSMKTIERYRELAEYVVRGATDKLAAVASTKVSNLQHTALEPALLSLLEAPAVRCDHLSTRTLRHIASVVCAALNKAWLLDLIPANPMLKVELPGIDPREVRALSPVEISALRDSCRGDWMFAFVELALATGCRRGELLALEWSDVNWTARSISVSKSVEQTRAGLRIKCTKGKRPRMFTLPVIAIEALQSQKLVTHGRLIFPDEVGDYLKPDLVSQLIVRRIRKAGIPDASLHSLRHAHATNLLSRGVPLPVISARLGHANPNVTARIYCHALALDDQRAADEWDRMVG